MVRLGYFCRFMKRINNTTQRILCIILVTCQVGLGQEKHLKNITQLTFGGDNAEGYFSSDGRQIVFQSNNKAWGLKCDQIFKMNWAEASRDSLYKPLKVSTGNGRTTCSYFMNKDRSIIYASTHHYGMDCPPPPEPKNGKYLWQVFDTYDLFVCDADGKNLRQLTNEKGYDAEATLSPDGKSIVFTSTRSGDLELWTMNTDGTNLKQITNTPGYDGGAFFSPDGSKIVFRASRPAAGPELEEYRSLLKEGLVAPTNMELFCCNLDGSELKQITRLGKANWAPFYLPDNKRIIFSSNHHSTRGYDFQLYIINEDGTGLERVSTESNFNSFPMFSPDGKHLIFGSNRNNHGTRDTNLFIAEWAD